VKDIELWSHDTLGVSRQGVLRIVEVVEDEEDLGCWRLKIRVRRSDTPESCHSGSLCLQVPWKSQSAGF
jgi:hypothetical protein